MRRISRLNLISKLVIGLLSPLGTALCLAALALLLAWQRRRRTTLALALLAFIWLWAWSTPVLSHWFGSRIESIYPQTAIAALPQAQAVMVLGGAVAPPSGSNQDIDLGAAADRVWYAARLFHAGKAPLLLLSGGHDPERDAFSEARAMASVLADFGVPAQALLLEESSRNTRENAVFSAALLKARGIERILLVTSALHMPRAVALFAAQGLQVIPAPTVFEASRAPPPGVLAWLPDAQALDASARAIKELVGRATGR